MLEEHFARWRRNLRSSSRKKQTQVAAKKAQVDVEKGTQPDDIVPFHFLDQDAEFQSSVPLFTLRFDAVLDVEKLRRALDAVFELDGWHKLGARIQRGDDGKLENRIPATYTPDQPAYNWSHIDYQTDIAQHPLACKVPDGEPSAVPTMYTKTDEWTDLFYPQGKLPRKRGDYIKNAVPPLTVHIASFTNATLLTIGWPHCAMDAIAASHLLRKWAAVLADQPGDQFMDDYNTDILQTIVDSKRTPANNYVLHDQRLSGFPMLGFFATMAYDQLRYRGTEFRTVCLPGSLVAQMKADAMQEIGGEFLSEGDIVSAWRNRAIARAIDLRPTKPILMIQYYSYFGVLPEFPGDRAYVGNAVAKMFATMSTEELLEQSLGKVALRCRNDLKQQRTQEQTEAFMTMQREHGIMLFGSWNQVLLGVSNISKAGLFQLDFSPAVKDSGSGKPTYVHNNFIIESKIQMRNVGAIMGKDGNGDWWLYWSMRRSAWPKIEKELADMQGIEVR